MKSKIALLLSAVSVVSAPLAAGSTPSKEPTPVQPNKKEIAMSCDTSKNSCNTMDNKKPMQDDTTKEDAKKKEIAMEGERMDNRMSDRANRDAEDGNMQGEQNMENSEQNADTRQDNREDRR